MTIVYQDEIISAYRDIPIIEINSIPFGAIINRTPGDLSWWPPFDMIGITADFGPIKGIIPYQQKFFGKHSSHVYSSHTLIHTFLGRYFEVTNPRSRYGILTKDNLDPAKVYTICTYSDAVVDTSEGRECFYEIFRLLDKTNYDYLQLVNMLIHTYLDWDKDKYLPLLDIGKNNKVCSVAAAVCWLNFYYKMLKDTRRPMGKWNAERVPPCLFESPYYNEGTFKIIGRLYSALLD